MLAGTVQFLQPGLPHQQHTSWHVIISRGSGWFKAYLVVLVRSVQLLLLMQLLRGCMQDVNGACLDRHVSIILLGMLCQVGLLCRDLSAQARHGAVPVLAPLLR